MSYSDALAELEQLHLRDQPHALRHARVHLRMFILALRHRQWKEVAGQVPRMLLAMPGTWLGRAPRGNVGTTRMGIFEARD